jgi:GntR family transcriptional regulator/MocR family aminotransferase
LQYQSRFSIGLDELRQNIAGYLRDSRGVKCNWDEIAITGGSQQALFLLGHLLLDEEHSAYMEDPGYPGARRSWEEANANVISVPVDDEGICLPLPEAPDAALIYVTPSHQFPLGTCMSLARRLALLDVARRRKLWIIEDDYDAEFRYTSAPQPSLQSLDEHRRVIYMGSFSKTLFPGLRLGYVVLPPKLVEPFTKLKMTADDQGPLIDQATLAAFLESGAFYAHLRRCRRVYSERQQFFLQLIKAKGLPLEFPVTGRGMNLAGRLPGKVDDRLLCTSFKQRGLDVPALSGYGIHTKIPGLLFGLTAFDQKQISAGVNTMAQLFSRNRLI